MPASWPHRFSGLALTAFGGGGKGIAKLERMEDLAETYTRLTREAEAAFGRGQLYMERFVSRMRHRSAGAEGPLRKLPYARAAGLQCPA